MNLKFGVLMFKEIREKSENLIVRNIIFLLQSFEKKKKNVQIFFIYIGTKFSIRSSIQRTSSKRKLFGKSSRP